MIERILVSPNRLLTRDAQGNTTFDSNELYLKTDPLGVFKAGGFRRCQVIAGQSAAIGDVSDAGGFPVFKLWKDTTFAGNVSFIVPPFDSIHSLTLHPPSALYAGKGAPFANTIESPILTGDVLINGVVVGQYSLQTYKQQHYVSGANYSTIVVRTTLLMPNISSAVAGVMTLGPLSSALPVFTNSMISIQQNEHTFSLGVTP